MSTSLHITAQHYIVPWHDPDPLAEIPASHEGVWTTSPEDAVSLTLEDLDEGCIVERSYGEGQLQRMYDFVRSQNRQAPKSFIVFYHSAEENTFPPRDRCREGWVVVCAKDYQDAIREADKSSQNPDCRAYLAYDESDIELILQAMIDSRLLQQFE